MQYDPIKRSLGNFFNSHSLLRRLFYALLDILLLRTWHIKRVLRELKKEKRDSIETILDAGSGFGQYLYRMGRIFPLAEIDGVDVKEEQIEDCNRFFNQIEKKNIHCKKADLVTFKEPNSYDLIISVDVMEHIEEDEAVFANLFASLKSSGTLVISTPSDKGGSDAHHHDEEESHGGSGFIDEHVRDGYSIVDIKEKLSRAGFSKIETKYTYGTMGHISWIFSMKFPILLLNKSKLFGILLLWYYPIILPYILILNLIDTYGSNSVGTGLIVVATKE